MSLRSMPSTSRKTFQTLLSAFWGGLQQRFQGLAAVAQDAIFMPVDASVDEERSFSQYKHLLNDRRKGLTEANTKQLLML